MLRLAIVLASIAVGCGFSFTASVSEIHPRLTHTMTMTCDLGGDLPDASFVVKHDGDDTTKKVTHVTSITLSRDDKDIAMVTKFDNATKFGSTFGVKGAVVGKVGEDSNLRLMWSYPTATDAGDYKCEVSGVTDHGHCVTFSRVLTLTFEANPTIEDLVDHIYNQQTTIKAMQDLITSFENKMTAVVTRFSHIENGSVVFSGPGSWNSTSLFRQFDQLVRFDEAYPAPPQVQIGVSGLQRYNNNGYNSRNIYQSYDTEVVKVSNNGFVLRCTTKMESHYHFDTLTVEWTSFPQ